MSRNTGWYRFYDRMIDSPQVLELNDTEFRLLVSMWCLASAAETRGTLPFSSRALQRRVLPDRSVDDIEQMLTHLTDLALIAPVSNGTGYLIVNWDEHQYEHTSWTPEARREQKRKERQGKQTDVASTSQAHRNDVASGRNIDADADAEPEREQEAEQDPTADVAAVVIPRAPARTRTTTAPAATAISSGANSGDDDLVVLCERIAQRTHLPQRVEVMEQLTAVLQSHLARGLSPGDIELDVLNLIDPSRPKHVKRPSVTQISNWLAHTHPAENLAAAVGASNGHHKSTGDRSNDSYIRGRRQPDLPDPTRNGRYATLVRVASDDGPDDDGLDEAAHDA